MADTATEITTAVALLTKHGWTCMPPINGTLDTPKPDAGQVWVSPKPRIEPRTITKLGKDKYFPWAEFCIFFTTPSGKKSSLPPESWNTWVKKSGARPLPLPAAAE